MSLQKHLKSLDSISLYGCTRVYLNGPILFGNIYCAQSFTNLNVASLLDDFLCSYFLASFPTLRNWPMWTDQLGSSYDLDSGWFWTEGSPGRRQFSLQECLKWLVSLAQRWAKTVFFSRWPEYRMLPPQYRSPPPIAADPGLW